MMHARTVVGNVASLTAMRVVTGALAVCLFWAIARFAGSDALGQYALAMATFYFLQQMPLLGLHTALTRDTATEPDRLRGRAGGAAMIAGLTGLMLAAGVAAMGELLYEGTARLLFGFVAISMLPTAYIAVVESILIGQQRLSLIAAVNTAEALFRTVASLFLLVTDWGLVSMFAVFFVGRIGAAAVYARRGNLPKMEWDTAASEEARDYLRQCPVFLAILFCSSALVRVDVFALSHLVSYQELGIYAAAAKFFELGSTFSAIVTLTIFPVFASEWRRDAQSATRLLRRVILWLLVPSIMGAVMLGFLARPVLDLLFGPSYAQAAGALCWLLGAGMLMIVNHALAMVLVAAGEQRLDLAALVLALAVALATLCWFVNMFGYLGAAMAICAAMAVQVAARLVWVWRFLGVSVGIGTIAGPLAAACAMLFAMIALRQAGTAAVMVGGAVAYAIAILITGTLGRDDFQRAAAGLRSWRGKAK